MTPSHETQTLERPIDTLYISPFDLPAPESTQDGKFNDIIHHSYPTLTTAQSEMLSEILAANNGKFDVDDPAIDKMIADISLEYELVEFDLEVMANITLLPHDLKESTLVDIIRQYAIKDFKTLKDITYADLLKKLLLARALCVKATMEEDDADAQGLLSEARELAKSIGGDLTSKIPEAELAKHRETCKHDNCLICPVIDADSKFNNLLTSMREQKLPPKFKPVHDKSDPQDDTPTGSQTYQGSDAPEVPIIPSADGFRPTSGVKDPGPFRPIGTPGQAGLQPRHPFTT